MARAYRVISLTDAIHAKNQEMHEQGLRDLSIFTKLMTFDEYKEAWEKGIDPWEGGGDPENKVK